jgi:anti-sigma B factor antagonist
MSLSVDSRSCGRVYVVKASGKIVAGEESRTLEAALTRTLQDSNRVVLNVADVSRVDSSGMGLLVRFLCRIKNNGGDFRLAGPQPFLRSLLDMTKLSAIFRVYDTEEEAIVSFLKEPAVPGKDTAPAGPLVLFLDQSLDLCAFVRKLLNGHGYEVVTTSRLHDAKLLASAADLSYVVLGPECANLPCDTVEAALQPLATKARFIHLGTDFVVDDADKAASDLLAKMQSASA